jgi:hypothetical protein
VSKVVSFQLTFLRQVLVWQKLQFGAYVLLFCHTGLEVLPAACPEKLGCHWFTFAKVRLKCRFNQQFGSSSFRKTCACAADLRDFQLLSYKAKLISLSSNNRARISMICPLRWLVRWLVVTAALYGHDQRSWGSKHWPVFCIHFFDEEPFRISEQTEINSLRRRFLQVWLDEFRKTLLKVSKNECFRKTLNKMRAVSFRSEKTRHWQENWQVL